MCKAADCLRNRPCMVFLFLHLWLEGPESSQYRLVHRLERLQAGWGWLLLKNQGSWMNSPQMPELKGVAWERINIFL